MQHVWDQGLNCIWLVRDLNTLLGMFKRKEVKTQFLIISPIIIEFVECIFLCEWLQLTVHKRLEINQESKIQQKNTSSTNDTGKHKWRVCIQIKNQLGIKWRVQLIVKDTCERDGFWGFSWNLSMQTGWLEMGKVFQMVGPEKKKLKQQGHNTSQQRVVDNASDNWNQRVNTLMQDVGQN